MNLKRHILFPVLALGLSTGCDRKPSDLGITHREGQPDVLSVPSEDAEMNAAIAQARQSTDAFLRVLSAPQPSQTDFSAKRPYRNKDGTGNEHIWISHLSYDGTRLHGVVGDSPLDIPNLRLGDEVAFAPSELTDWMYLENGKIVGGYTIRVLRENMPVKEAAEFDAHFQFKD